MPQSIDNDNDDPIWQPPSNIDIQPDGPNDKKNQTEASMFSSDINDYNTLNLTKTAEACEKLALGNASAAHLINAVFMDLKFVTKDNPQNLVTPTKIERERERRFA